MDTRKIAREIAEGSMVLLKNEGGLLPFACPKQVAMFGRAVLQPIISGNGSGAAAGTRKTTVQKECEALGLTGVPALEDFYSRQVEAEQAAGAAQPQMDFERLKELVHSGMMYEFFGKYTPPAKEFPVPEDVLQTAAAATDTALLILGRSSGGEECDRHLYDDFYLTGEERTLMGQVCTAFPKVVVVLNVNGLIDMSWLKEYPSIRALLFAGIPGEEGPAALANLLTGRVNPSGKMAVTVADYGQYPTAEHFSWDKEGDKENPHALRAILTYEDYGLSAGENGSAGFAKSPVTVYQEDIYLGYRYFDSNRIEPVFPFGFGLSYTEFAFEGAALAKAEQGFVLSAQVQNVGAVSGRETAQLYISAQGTHDPRPYQELKGFAKTALLAPGEREEIRIFVPWRELASYEEERGAWVIAAGSYVVRLGNSSRHNSPVGSIAVPEEIIVFACGNRLELRRENREKLRFTELKCFPQEGVEAQITLTAAQVTPFALHPLAPAAPELQGFTLQELMALCVGYGPGTPFAGIAGDGDPATVFDENGQPVTTNTHPTGHNGYVSPAIERRGISSVFYKDGPAGVGHMAWPSEMLMACSFDTGLLRAFGGAVASEAQEDKVDLWLAPAVNLHRHPLGGRNFEYFSEDPFLSGALACALAAGCQEGHPVMICAKHFAANEQETYRRGSSKLQYDAVDSIVSERALRELYLKPFEMLVRSGYLHCIMSSFNKINGVFAGGSKDLCTHILREEWGFDGLVVTDWGDMDVVVDGADAVAAGNDVIMPGGPPVIGQILRGYEEGRVTRQQLELAVSHLLSMISRFGRYQVGR